MLMDARRAAVFSSYDTQSDILICVSLNVIILVNQ